MKNIITRETYKMIEPGIYPDLDIDDYHASEGISSSGISLILDCPRRYWGEYIANGGHHPKDTEKKREKFMLGRAVHMLVLEPEKFDDHFYYMNENVNLASKAGKEMYLKAKETAGKRQIIRASDWININHMAQSIKESPIWKKIREPKVEHSIFWDGGIFKTRLRARPDMFTDRLIIDVKTTDCISNFSKSIYRYGYHRQAAMQIDGLKQLDGKERFFAFFVVEKKHPNLTICYTLDEQSISKGREEYLDGAAIYAECLRKDEWPGYDCNFQLISIPKWSGKKDDT